MDTMGLCHGTSLDERYELQRTSDTHQHTLNQNASKESEQRSDQGQDDEGDASKSLLRKELEPLSSDELIEMIIWLKVQQRTSDETKKISPLRRSSRILKQRTELVEEADKIKESCLREELKLVTNKELIEMIIRLKEVSNTFSTLPDEIIVSIFNYLPQTMLGKTAQVCKRWREISYDPIFWKKTYFEEHERVKSGQLSHILDRECQLLVFIVGCSIELPIFTDEKPRKSYKLKQLFFSSTYNKIDNELHLILSRCRELVCIATMDARVDDKICHLIGKNPNISQVMFYTTCNEVSYKGYLAIITGCRRLENFSAYKWHIEGDILQMSANEITSLIQELPPTIKELVIFRDCHHLTDEHIELLVTKHPDLTHLSVSACPLLTAQTIDRISRLSHLVELDIAQCINIPQDALRPLAACTHLRKLSASGVVTLNGAKILGQLLPKCCVITTFAYFPVQH